MAQGGCPEGSGMREALLRFLYALLLHFVALRLFDLTDIWRIAVYDALPCYGDDIPDFPNRHARRRLLVRE